MALVEALQHAGVGPLKQPLLAQGGGVARVHEDPPLARATVDAAVADRVIQALVLEETAEQRSRFTFCCCRFHSNTRGLADRAEADASESVYGTSESMSDLLLSAMTDAIIKNVTAVVKDFRSDFVFFLLLLLWKRPKQSKQMKELSKIKRRIDLAQTVQHKKKKALSDKQGMEQKDTSLVTILPDLSCSVQKFR